MPQPSDARAYSYNAFEIAIEDAALEHGETLAADLAKCLGERFRVGIVRDVTPQRRIVPSDEPVRLLLADTHEVMSAPRGTSIGLETLLDCDCVLVQRSHAAAGPKIVVVGDGPIEERGEVVAYVADRASCPILPAHAPFFTTDQVSSLAEQVARWMTTHADSVPLHGLVLAGGESCRMGEDKARIRYHDAAQADHAAGLLAQVCETVYISTRDEGAAFEHPTIADRFLGFGPMGGILSAMTAHPEAAWFVLACDLPFVDEHALEYLLERRHAFGRATVFERDGIAEPCCAIYEPKAAYALHHAMAAGYYSLQGPLDSPTVRRVSYPSAECLANVNTPAERDAAQAKLAHRVLQ